MSMKLDKNLIKNLTNEQKGENTTLIFQKKNNSKSFKLKQPYTLFNRFNYTSVESIWVFKYLEYIQRLPATTKTTYTRKN